MWTWVKDLDRILRGDATKLSALRRGTIELPVGGVTAGVILLGMLYGICMGFFALFRKEGPVYIQLVASMVKVPLLFFLTLVVTFPSLYVFNALVGSRLSALAVLRLLVASIAVILAVLASFGLIVAFFSVSTTSYAFILLLNVVAFGIAGAIGLRFMLQTLHRLSIAQNEPPEPTALPGAQPEVALAIAPDRTAIAASQEAAAQEELAAVAPSPEPMAAPPVVSPPPGPVQPAPERALAPGMVYDPYTGLPLPKRPEPSGALDRLEGRVLGQDVKTVFRVWVIAFGLVGAQMGWVLRPFVGSPDRHFAWFRGRESSFFEGVLWALRSLFS